MNRQPSLSQRQRGIGLIEVIIALLIFSISVLGFAALQMTALTQSNDANHRSIAVLIAQDAVERMQVNTVERDSYLAAGNWAAATYGTTPPRDCINVAGAGRCSAVAMADFDRAELAWLAANQLPGGRIIAEQCRFNEDMNCVIVSWDEQDPADCTSGNAITTDADSKCFVLEVMR